MSCPKLENTVSTPEITLQTLKDEDGALRFIGGKRGSLPQKLFEEKVNNKESKNNTFSDWVLVRFNDKKNVPNAFFSFNGNLEGSSRSSKRINAMNPTLIKFLSRYPEYTIFEPPTNEESDAVTNS